MYLNALSLKPYCLSVIFMRYLHNKSKITNFYNIRKFYICFYLLFRIYPFVSDEIFLFLGFCSKRDKNGSLIRSLVRPSAFLSAIMFGLRDGHLLRHTMIMKYFFMGGEVPFDRDTFKDSKTKKIIFLVH